MMRFQICFERRTLVFFNDRNVHFSFVSSAHDMVSPPRFPHTFTGNSRVSDSWTTRLQQGNTAAACLTYFLTPHARHLFRVRVVNPPLAPSLSLSSLRNRAALHDCSMSVRSTDTPPRSQSPPPDQERMNLNRRQRRQMRKEEGNDEPGA